VRRAALLALAAFAAGCGGASRHDAAHPEPRESPFAGAELPVAKRAPDLALRDQDGALVRLSAQRGRYVVVTFLYTHCPDVCPLIAANLNTALRSLGARRDGVRVLAVSVDPQGDTPAAVRAYGRRLRLLPQFRYLIGTKPQLMRVWRDYGVLAVARDKELVDHVASTMLVDRRGRRRVLYGANVKAADVVHDLRVLSKNDAAG
jgi:protein SCO1/2